MMEPQNCCPVLKYSLVLCILIGSFITCIAAQCNYQFVGGPTDQSPDPKKVIESIQGKVSETGIDKHEDGDSHQYKVSICEPVDKKNVPGAGAVQIIYDPNGEVKEHVDLGKIAKSEIYSGSGWMLLKYHDGQKYASFCNKASRTTSLMLLCDQESAALNNKAKLIAEITSGNASECGSYFVEIQSSAICQTVVEDKGLSTGSILVILFCVFFGGYMLLGVCYRRFLLGAQGVEQMPHHHFWIDFGNLQADGCNFICRTKASDEYRGTAADDQLVH